MGMSGTEAVGPDKLEHLAPSVASSSPAKRIAALGSLQEVLQEDDTFTPRDYEQAIHLILPTYHFYNDRKSRLAVREILENPHLYPPHTSLFVDQYASECNKRGIAPTSALVLLEWGLVVFRQFQSDDALASWVLRLLSPFAQVYETCIASNTKTRKSVLQVAKHVAGDAASELTLGLSEERRDKLVKVLTSKESGLGPRAAPFLGILADKFQCRRDTFKHVESDIFGFYNREVLGSRVELPLHIASGLGPFFTYHIALESLQKEIVPPLERALLRAPEVILQSVITPLIESIFQDIDLTFVVHDHLLKPLLSNAKSQNETIRAGVVTAFRVLASRCRNEGGVQKILKQLLDLVRQSKAVTERQCVAQMLEAVPRLASSSSLACQALSKVALKETSEIALASEIEVLLDHAHRLSGESPALKATIEAIDEGLKDKKSSIRRLWATKAGQGLRNSAAAGRNDDKDQILDSATLSAILILFDEVVENAFAAAQNGTAVAGFIAVTLHAMFPHLNKDAKRIKSKSSMAIAIANPLSFLLNPRVYTKIDPSDISWLARALSACGKDITQAKDEIQTAWGEAFTYCICANGQASTRREAIEQLSRCYSQDRAAVGRIVVHSLWKWHLDACVQKKESPSTSDRVEDGRLLLVLFAICPRPVTTGPHLNGSATASAELQLIDMLVLCRPEVIPGAHWIDLNLRMGVDPGSLVKENADECLSKIKASLASYSSNPEHVSVATAAFNAAAELAFVAPEAMTPLLVSTIQETLSPAELEKIGNTEISIARTPEGTTYIDVLGKPSQTNTVHKGSANYEDAKWEAEVRAEVAKKKGLEKKLTPDQKAKVQAQLGNEGKIRRQVQAISKTLAIGAGLVSALANGPPTDAEQWLNASLTALLHAIRSGASDVVGNVVDDAYVSCADLVTARLGAQRRFIGIATLRAEGSSSIPPNLLEESLESLVSRTLHRVHFLSAQRPLDVVSLTYVLPLVFVVLRTGGVGNCVEEMADEQVTLALELIEFHLDELKNISLPRTTMLEILVSSLQRYNQHYKLIRDCLVGVAGSVASTITETETKVLLAGTIAPQQNVRAAALQAIRDHIDLTDLDFCEEIWLAYHDDVEENAAIAQLIWEENALDFEPPNASQSIPYLQSPHRPIRSAASRALAECIGDEASVFNDTIHKLEDEYRELARPRQLEKDAFGMPLKKDLADPWYARHGIGLAFKELAPIFDTSVLVPFIDFLIKEGAVGDKNSTVRDSMVESAAVIVNLHGASHLEELMEKFEAALEASEMDAASSDLVSEAVVILYGSLARHLPSGDPKVPQVVNRLLATLATPSESVQYAVANCLPPLVRNSLDKMSDYIQSSLDTLFKTKKFAARRGAAYGLAGIVKGKGVLALREYRIMSALKAASENKKDQNQRQGAVSAYELLALLLGRTFEPYIIQIVPQLLSSFGDPSADVREACLDASKTCFSNLSSFGVKIILPELLEGLDETQWRSKKGACDLLGAMAYLDPQQLAISLPDIIPPLTNVLNDSHKEVRQAANRSLQRFGEVISNPEVKGLVSILLKALSDPTKYTDDALDSLIKVSFVHYLDAPSLALIVRILQRGLSDRSQTKRKSAQIIGSLAHLTERKDVVAHLPILVEGLRSAIVDPVPSTRATASKALGSLVEKLGEDALPDLIPSLMTTLKADTGAGDRLGSAQALSEVLAGLGTSRLEDTLPNILQNASSNKPSVREGFMTLFIYLPACFGNSFANYLSKVIPPILSGLADEVESIRETALRAGRLLVKNFATKSIDLLLPELDRGLADINYRIRLSSVELVGDLLFSLTGISSNADDEEDEDEAAPEASTSLLEALGQEKRDKILSSLYICRCDTSGLVRVAAINVWKSLVSTPRTLKELVPTLSQLLIRRLASSNMEQKVIAGNALGELIRKAGEGVLATLLPTLEEGLKTSTDTDHRQGICIALREITSAASSEAIESYEKVLIGVVRVALVDADDEVREAAAEAFDSLQQILGKKAVDQVLPYLLNLLRSEGDADTALAALLTLLTDNTRSNIILPNLIPTLLVSPVSTFNAKAIASLAKVAGQPMNRRLPTILNTLMDDIVKSKDGDHRNALEDAFDSILLSVDEFDGLNTMMSVMLALTKNADHNKRATADLRLNNFSSKAEIDFSRYYPDLIRVLLISFDDSDASVIKAAWQALATLTQRLKKEEMESLVTSTRQTLLQVGVPGSNLAGFALPKGISAILPIFLQGLMNGNADQKIAAALAISDTVSRTSVESLKPFVVPITGPLIRIVSERSTDVKSAILLTLNNLLEKVTINLKPFLPQLQRTFAKCLADPNSEILRSRAAKALGTLITLTPRVDPLIAELVTGSKTPDPGVQAAMLKALYEVVSKAGASMSESSRSSILTLTSTSPAGGESDPNDSILTTYARLFGALIGTLPSDASTAQIIKSRALPSTPSPSSILNLNSILAHSASSLIPSLSTETVSHLTTALQSPQTFIADNAVLAAGKFLLSDPPNQDQASELLKRLAALLAPTKPIDTRRLTLVVIRTLSRRNSDLTHPLLSDLAQPIFSGVRDPVIPVKLAAEAAFVSLFDVADSESAIFDEWMASPEGGAKLAAGPKRSMSDYFRRVALRLGAQVRERREAEGGADGLGLSSDEAEDESEIWSVGRLEVGDKTFAID